jgi:hypothetical protein
VRILWVHSREKGLNQEETLKDWNGRRARR